MSELKAINMPRLGAEDIKSMPENTCVISITGTQDPFANLVFPGANDLQRCLRVEFDDVTSPVEYKGSTLMPMGAMQAKAIAGWIHEHRAQNFIVHCEAGISRSGAVALFIHTQYGHALRDNFWLLSEPNPQVLGILLREHMRPAS